MYRWGSRRGHSFSLWLNTTVFQGEIYITNAGKLENALKGCRGRNSQAAIKVLESFQINSKLVWDCHQSLVKLAEY
jgi:hypothetical protein